MYYNKIILITLISIIIIFLIFLIISECYFELENYTIDKSELTNIQPNKFHIYMCYDKNYGELFSNKFAEINKKYCKKYGFNFHKKIIKLDENKKITYNKNSKVFKSVPHFGRYLFLKELMDRYPKDHIFMYIDSDACVINNNVDLSTWIPNKNINIIFGNEFKNNFALKVTGALRNIAFGINFNSGIIISKNNDWVQNFLNNILYSKVYEINRNKKVLSFYDQTVISKLFYHNKNNHQVHIKVISLKNPIQHSTFNLQNKIPILHATGLNRNKIRKFLINSLNGN